MWLKKATRSWKLDQKTNKISSPDSGAWTTDASFFASRGYDRQPITGTLAQAVGKGLTGHCACGQVTYGFDTEPTFVANCHCMDCKRASGGEMATIALVPDTDFTLFSGNTKRFSYGPNPETCAGKGLDRVFCANCGSRLVTNNLKDFPDYVFVQEGTLDRLDKWFAPKVEIFTWSREKWMPPLDLPQFDHGPKLNGSHDRRFYSKINSRVRGAKRSKYEYGSL